MKIAIGIDLDWPFEHHYGIARGILQYGKERGWDCGLEPWMETTEDIDDVPDIYDGIISRVNPSLKEVCERKKIPLVNVWFNSPVKDVPLVARNGKLLGEKMADYFYKKGFQKILFFGSKEDRNGLFIIDGMQKFLEKRGLSSGSCLVKTPMIKKEWEEFNAKLDKWFLKIELPVAIACSDHITARYLCEWCKKRKLLVPDDVAVLSAWSNDLICESFEPSLSHIRNRFNDIGYGAANMLHKLISGESIETPLLFSPGEIRERRSTDVEPVSDRIIARAMRYIWDNSVNPILVEDVARYMEVSRRSLERKFRKILDRTINEEILRTRLERAKRLLRNSDKTAKAIAEESGFASDQRLAQVFRQKLGMSAIEYRKQNKVSVANDK